MLILQVQLRGAKPMISVKFDYNKDTGTISLRMKGHAGQAEKGHDLVCASASILAYTVAKYVEYVDDADGMMVEPHIEMDEGYTLIVANPTEEYIAEVLNAFFVAEVGFSLLEQNYPQYVEVKMLGETEQKG